MKFIKRSFLFFILLSLFGFESFSEEEKRVKRFLNLYIGLDHDELVEGLPRNFKTPGQWRKLLGVSYSAKKKTFRFRPKKEGTTVFLIEERSTGKILYEFHMSIQKTDLIQTAHEIKSLIQDIDGVTVKILNNKVLLDGYVLLPQEITRIYNVLQRYPDKATSLVSLNPIAERKIASLIQSDTQIQRISTNITVRTVNGNFILQGEVGSDAEKKDIETIALAYVPDLILEEAFGAKVKARNRNQIINMIKIKKAEQKPIKKAIHLVMHFVSMKKDFNKSFRFQWTPGISDETQVSIGLPGQNQEQRGFVSQVTATISNLLPKLNWAKEHGYARVLQSASLTVEEGKKGLLEATTQVPYQTIGSLGAVGTETSQSGVSSEVTPTIVGERGNDVALQMSFTSSKFTGQAAGRPIVATNKVQSEMVVRNGQSVAVGGLVDSSRIVDFNKLPQSGASDPILSLYTSKGFNKRNEQFVIFITPRIKTSASEGVERVKEKFKMGS